MDLFIQPFGLRLTRRWTIASRTGPGGGPGTDEFPVVLVRLRDANGCEGLGESAPSNRYGETAASVAEFLRRVDPRRLSFDDLPASRAYLDTLSSGDHAAKGALDVALTDGAAKRAGKTAHDFLGLPFTEGRHLTSFSIGLDTPEVIHTKVKEAAHYPVLKLKLGSATDRDNLAALRAAAPDKTVRVDANEAWKSKETALKELEWLANDGHVEFVEQPMPAAVPRPDWEWLKERSPLPIMADESYRFASDLETVLGCFHAVNVKLVKAGGVNPAHQALRAARNAGLKTMLGCMIETSILIAAAAHLADLTDYLDIDGNLLVNNDPFSGPTAVNGRISFADAPAPTGLRVARRHGAPI
ncbi:MAG: dipeptide epimerase [Verrucomicrobiales bacterium]|nr:dipeptide epimerase [Verrucomicrobiales bacterium]